MTKKIIKLITFKHQARKGKTFINLLKAELNYSQLRSTLESEVQKTKLKLLINIKYKCRRDIF